MRDKVRDFIRQHGLLQEGDKVIVALSGGADSVTLLHILISLKEEYDLTLYALHFHHGIRGEEADRDEQFARALCGELGISYHAGRADVPSVAAELGESLETCGRRLRYVFLTAFADRIGGAKIATAHNRNDNTETVMLNLVRGAAITGLGGIPIRRGQIIRPLLCCSRDEIEAYCREQRLQYVTDSTNLDDTYTRNKLRLHVLPALREVNPSLDEGISRTAAVMREADEYLNKISLEELKGCKTTYGYRCDKLLSLDRAVLRYTLRNIAESAGAPVDFSHIALMIQALSDGGAVELGHGYRAECAQGVLRIIRGGDRAADFCVPFSEAYATRCDTAALIATGKANGEKINKKFFNSYIPCDIITDDTVVRHRRAGDTFTDARRGVTKTVKKLLNELKVPRELRDGLLVVAQGSKVLWLQGVGASKEAQVDPERDKEVYLIHEMMK